MRRVNCGTHQVPTGIAIIAICSLTASAATDFDPGLQRNTSPDGHQTCLAWGRPALPEEREDRTLAPDAWVQEGPRDSYNRGTVPLPLAPDWVGSRVRAVGALVWFDADNDQDEDLFVGTYWANQWPPLEDYYNFLYLNNGGTLEANPSWISMDEKHTGDAAWGNINGDAYPDLFLANGGSSLQPCQVFYGRDGILPNAAGWQNNGGAWTTGCSLADFDLDGDVDAATSNQGVQPNPYRPTTLFRNLGTVLETTPSWQSNQVGITSECDWGDMDGDARPELAVSGWVGWHTGVFRNLGTTLDPDFFWTTGHAERTDKGVGWADVDGDEALDLAVGGNGDPDWLFRNEGGALGAEPVWSSAEAYTGCQDLAWCDIDRDGDQDLITIHFSTGHVRVHLNNGGALSSTADWQYDAASSGSAIGLGDVNGDGWTDLAIGVANGPVELFVNRQVPAGIGESASDLPAGNAVALCARGNPARGRIALTVGCGEPTRIARVEILDLTGRRIAEIAAPSDRPTFLHDLTWSPGQDGIEPPPDGIVFVRARGLRTDGREWEASTRVVWLRE